MPHLALNKQGWWELSRAHHITRLEDVAYVLNLDVCEVEAVFRRGVPPSEHFVAACLANIPMRFDELFVIDQMPVAA